MSFGPPKETVGTAFETVEVETPAVTVYGARKRTRSAIAKGSGAKGATAERAVLSAFRDCMVNVEQALEVEGYKFFARSDFATRKRLSKGTSNRDLGNIPLISIEIKRREKLAVESWWDQTMKQCDPGELPVLIYRANHEPWTCRTWLAFVGHDGSFIRYVKGEVSLPDFLSYYSQMYREFLKRELKDD